LGLPSGIASARPLGVLGEARLVDGAIAAGHRPPRPARRRHRLARLPHLQQRDDHAGREQRRDDVGQLDRQVVRARELPDREGQAAPHGDRPRGLDAAAPVDHADEDQRDDQRQERRLAPDHRAEVVLREVGQRRERGDRHGDRSERHRRGVGDQRHRGRLDRLEAQADQHHRADSHRRSEAGERLEQRAEAERDEHRLHALVVAEPGERALDDGEVPAALGHVVDPDRVDDDPHDREQAERRSLDARVERLAYRHRVDDDRNQDRDRQRAQRGDVRLQPQATEQHEQGDQRQRREEGRPTERVADRIEHLLVHAHPVL
jgi:hypothetical protein